MYYYLLAMQLLAYGWAKIMAAFTQRVCSLFRGRQPSVCLET
jgi:hypothetical protein